MDKNHYACWLDIARNKFADVEVSVPKKIETKKHFDQAEHEAQTNLVPDGQHEKRSIDGSIRIQYDETTGLSHIMKVNPAAAPVIGTLGQNISRLKACLSPNKELLAVAIKGGQNGLAIIRLGETINVIACLEGIGTYYGTSDEVTDCCFSPDNKHLAVTRVLSPAMLYCTKSWQILRRLAISKGASQACLPYFSAPGYVRLSTCIDRGIPTTKKEDALGTNPEHYPCVATFKLPKEKEESAGSK
jgi:WD40 repeat protein